MKATAVAAAGFVAAVTLFALPASAQEKSITPPVVSAAPADATLDPKALWDGRKIAPFRALDDPKTVPAAEAAEFLEDDEYVLGVTVGGESRAYPTRFIWFHHVVNDGVGASRIAVTYCSVCNTGIAYDAALDGKPVKLDFFGLYNGVVALCDRGTESVFLQVTGGFGSGPLAGKALKPLPTLDTTWARWKQLHPETRVMSPDNEFRRYYRPKGKANAEPRGYDAFPAPFFAPTVSRADKRLPPFDKVLAVTLPAGEGRPQPVRRAYPVKDLEASPGVLAEEFSGVPVVILFDPKTVSAAAFSPRVDGRPLTLEARKGDDGAVTYVDKETGTRWSLEGVAEEGGLKGKRLTPLDSHLSQWYGWVAYFPDTTIYGRSDPPRPALWSEVAPPPTKKADAPEKRP